MKVSTRHLMYGMFWGMMALQIVVLANSNVYTILTRHVSAEATRLQSQDTAVPEAFFRNARVWYDSAATRVSYARMQNIRRHCGQLLAYLDSVSRRIALASGGYKGDTIALRYPYDHKWQKAVFPNGEGVLTMLSKVDTLNEFMIRNLLPGSYMRPVLRARLQSKWGDKGWDEQGPFREALMHAIPAEPAAGAIATIAAIRQGVALAEGEILNQLRRDGTPRCCWCGEAITALAIPQSFYVMPGMPVLATIGIAAYDRGARLRNVSSTTGTISRIESGIATWKARAGSAGKHTVAGSIWIQVDTGIRKFPWAFSYMSIRPDAGIQLHKTAIIYRGIDNAATISVPGISADSLLLDVPGAQVVSVGKGRYTIRALKPRPGKLIARIIRVKEGGATDTVSGMELTIRNPPLPVAAIGSGATLTGADLRKTGMLSFLQPDEDFQIPYAILSYEFSYLKQGARQVMGPYAILGPSYANHPDLSTFLQSAATGDKIFLTEIVATSPDGNRIFPAPVVYRLE